MGKASKTENQDQDAMCVLMLGTVVSFLTLDDVEHVPVLPSVLIFVCPTTIPG
jgi:hypothetical protein